ncbi:100K [Psittacine adenovirus 2]|uniref:100K n=1 Tax=Psittacine adenovirus 2 TaxID=1301246 RepID=A0ABX8SQY6_9ADEN|nr:100K [Psittacine adenovirus 2]QZW33254.1 ORF15 100K [Psittacine siadenovirus F]WGL41023.1 100K [Psittacine siadenovirus F]WGL41048.1 100K [Psittacine siadenovirus F]
MSQTEQAVEEMAENPPESNKENEVQVLTSADAGEFERSSFAKHLQRQAQICRTALCLKYRYLPESVSEIGFAFEEFLFNPPSREERDQQEARLNFYPPFLIPERTACYNSFFMILPIPLSCLANRSGTSKLDRLKRKEKFDTLPLFNEGMFIITDGLGAEVSPTDSLPRNNRLVSLERDSERLRVVKEKLNYVNHFAFPALNFPPKIHKQLVSLLYKPVQTGKENIEDLEYSISDAQIQKLVREKYGENSETEAHKIIVGFRENILKAIQYVAPLKFLQFLLRHPNFVKKAQEILHYTFHHGFIRLVGEVTSKNLSNYVTFHGMTFENHNNNACLHTTLDLNDGEDYMVDTIYLFLVLTVQTVMGIWQQNLNDKNMDLLRSLLEEKSKELIFCENSDQMGEKLAVWITDDKELVKVFHEAIPDFISQTQIQNFRSFILARSNIAGCLIPALPKDFVPMDFNESPPRLWSHVYLLRLSYFLYNHGDYYQTFFFNDSESKTPENEIYCHCNLCAPHRIPTYNTALHNEILAIGTFDFYVPDEKLEGQRLTLSAGMWANKYLDHFVAEEFFPFEVKKYIDYPELFKKEMTACVITKPKVLSSIRQIQKQKEKFLLEKGSGNYLDPQTGELINDTKLLSQTNITSRSIKNTLGRPCSEKDKKEKENTR